MSASQQGKIKYTKEVQTVFPQDVTRWGQTDTLSCKGLCGVSGKYMMLYFVAATISLGISEGVTLHGSNGARLDLDGESGYVMLSVNSTAVLISRTPAAVTVSTAPLLHFESRYTSVTSTSSTDAVASADVSTTCGTVLRVVDTYSVCSIANTEPTTANTDSTQLSFCLSRNVTVLPPSSGEPSGLISCGGGFFSLYSLQHVSNEDTLETFIPGLIYGNNSGPPWAIGGDPSIANVFVREDRAAAPILAVHDSATATFFSVMRDVGAIPNTVLNETLQSEPYTDARLAFGSLGYSRSGGSLDFGWVFPGSEFGRSYVAGSTTDGGLWRFHPHVPGFSHETKLVLSVTTAGGRESTPWLQLVEWAWTSADRFYAPTVRSDINLTDALQASVLALSTMFVDRGQQIAGVPSGAHKITGEVYSPSLQMGFVGPQFREAFSMLWWGINQSASGNPAAATASAQAKRMIDGWVQANNDDSSGLSHTNWDLNLNRWCDDDGMWTCTHPGVNASRKVFLRREVVGHWHTLASWVLLNRTGTETRPAWLAATTSFGDWLVQHQASNGSWPRALQVTTFAGQPTRTTVSEHSPSATAIPVRFLVDLWTVTRNISYLTAATSAANYAWENYGQTGGYRGAALDNPDVIDKESALFAMDGFLALSKVLRAPGDGHWQDRAVSAGLVAATWHRLTNVPNPIDAVNSMDWAARDTSCGLGLIALGHSGSDTFASMFAASFSSLAQITKMPLMIRMAQLQAYNTKQPMDLDGSKQYFHRGFMSELFSFSTGWNVFTKRNDGRGIGDPNWVPWVSANAAFGLISWFEGRVASVH